MSIPIKEELEADARRCGFDDLEALLALNELRSWAIAQGFDASYGLHPRRDPRHRFVVIRAERYRYQLQLEPEPLFLRLDVTAQTGVTEPFQPFVLGFWTMVDHEAWSLVRTRILAAEAGQPEPL